MAIPGPTETLTLTSEERTWRMEMFSEHGTDYTLIGHRETNKYDLSGGIHSQVRGQQSTRFASAITRDQYTALGVTVSGKQLVALIAQAVDDWRTYDIANPRSGPASQSV